jgi:hypothetical protein
MNRREALRNLALVTGGLVLVPSCDFSKEDILQAYDSLSVTSSQRNLLAQVADTIIPPGKIKGAADLEVQDFILVMVNDCMPEESRKSFSNGLSGFDKYSKNKAGATFSKLEASEREKIILQGLQDEGNQDIRQFLQQTKRFTIQGFMASEYIMTEVKPYSLIPGDYQGQVSIADLKTDRIHG